MIHLACFRLSMLQAMDVSEAQNICVPFPFRISFSQATSDAQQVAVAVNLQQAADYEADNQRW